MTPRPYVVIGAGPTGRGVSEVLTSQGHPVRVVTRTGKAALPNEAEGVLADIADPESAKRACADAKVVFGCVGLPSYREWRDKWPDLMSGLLAGAESAGARLVFMDNLYMYGPVEGPLHEDLPLTDYGRKPALRSRITRMWQEAHASGRVKVVAVRASDFYGPGVRNALLGDYVTKAAVAGRTANLLGEPEMPHTFTYMPDIVRTLLSIGQAADDVCGQAWHVPSAPARPAKEVVEMIYREAGKPLKIRVVPRWMMGLFGLFDSNLSEMKELLYQWTRPFEMDHSKFAARFWDDYTPLAQGIRETVQWFQLSTRDVSSP